MNVSKQLVVELDDEVFQALDDGEPLRIRYDDDQQVVIYPPPSRMDQPQPTEEILL